MPKETKRTSEKWILEHTRGQVWTPLVDPSQPTSTDIRHRQTARAEYLVWGKGNCSLVFGFLVGRRRSGRSRKG